MFDLFSCSGRRNGRRSGARNGLPLLVLRSRYLLRHLGDGVDQPLRGEPDDASGLGRRHLDHSRSVREPRSLSFCSFRWCTSMFTSSRTREEALKSLFAQSLATVGGVLFMWPRASFQGIYRVDSCEQLQEERLPQRWRLRHPVSSGVEAVDKGFKPNVGFLTKSLLDPALQSPFCIASAGNSPPTVPFGTKICWRRVFQEVEDFKTRRRRLKMALSAFWGSSRFELIIIDTALSSV